MDMKTLLCIVVLLSIVLILLIKLMMLKGNIRRLIDQLKNTRQEDYNRPTRVTLNDKDLEELSAEINRNIDYQKSLKLETEKSRRQLEQSIVDIAHDLRTPLTVVKGNLQMLEKEELSDKGRTYLEVSGRKTETLKGMVDEFFELSVLESDSKPVELQKLDATVFLSEFIIENETIIRQNNLTPEITFPEKAVYIQANKAMLSRVFSNLFGNIYKYAVGSFELSLEEDGETCQIRIGNKVADSSSIDIEHIFDRTYRADKARSDGSAGLGLYIAKLLLEKQKGKIEAELEEDKLVFTIMLLSVGGN
ncbi:MAG: HAMP domain-containing histidine kinase [Eubacterium sp.]|nr:HAMP domain-containing histidine kinase [Eubacterium sp.]